MTINQSLIIGTHSETAGILNFLTNSSELSFLIYFIFQGVEYREAVFLCQRISRASLPSLPGIPPFLPRFRKKRVTNLRAYILAQGAEFAKPKSELGERCFFYAFSNCLERFTLGLKTSEYLKAQLCAQKWRRWS